MVKKAVVKRIKELKKRWPKPTISGNNPRSIAYVETAPAIVHGKPSKRQLIAFRTPSCTHGKCIMCGFGSEAVENLSLDDLKTQLNRFKMIDDGRLSLCTESSFFHPKISPVFLEYLFNIIQRKKGITEIDLEMCASDVIANIDRIRKLRETLRKNQILYVGMGLETYDDFIRNELLGKNLTKELFEHAMQLLGEAGTGVYAYVILKPPGLEEAEAVTECIHTIEYFFSTAKKYGTENSRATLKPLFIPKNTIVEQLFEEGLIRTPKLWSLLKVLEKTSYLGTIFSPLTDENLAKGRIPENCGKCTGKIRKAVRKFNADQDVKPLVKLNCECKKEWKKEVNVNETKK